MPTYQYACTACGDRLEVVQKFTDDALTECAACGGRLRKVFSAVGVVFKGSGFYRTDSRASAKAESHAQNGEGSQKSDSGGKTEQDGSSESGAKESAPAGSSANGSSANGSSGSSSGSGPSEPSSGESGTAKKTSGKTS